MDDRTNPSVTAGDQADGAGPPTFQDWAQLISFQPRLYFRPRSTDELASFLTAIGQGTLPSSQNRVLGSLHSCSEIFLSDTAIDPYGLPRAISFSADNSVVTASANWSLHDFLFELSKRGKSLPATGGTDEQSLAGIISTNTAPATPQTSIYSGLRWVEYVTLDPTTRKAVTQRVQRGDPDFNAVVCSIGAIGVLTTVQFDLVDEPFFSTVQKVVPLTEMLGDVGNTSKAWDFWRIDWVPDRDIGLMWAAQRVAREQSDPNGDYPTDQSENAVQFIFKFLDKIAGAGPLLDEPMRLVYDALALVYGEVKATGPLRNMLPVDRRAPLHVAMAEWSFDPSDLKRLLQACRDYYKQSGWPNLPIEIELTKTDDYFMSPWNWPGLPYIVKFNFMYLTDVCDTPAKRELIYTHLHGLWDYLVAAGIPFKAHWGKINFMDYAFVRDHYRLDQFSPLIRRAFVNDYLAVRLFPPA